MQATRLPPQLLLQHNRLGCDGHDMGDAISKSAKKLLGFTVVYLCKALEIADRCAADRTSDRVGAAQE
jgi:methylmalonyl-CoA mutase cobalamin-binding subunit